MALFGGSDQSLNITLKAKDEASATIDKVRLSIGDIAKGAALGSLAVHGLESSFHLLEDVLSDSLHEWEVENQAISQMNAVLASTQHAAGLTAKEVFDLSNSLSTNTLYMDDQILSAENLLLTFTNIGKDTFPRATQAILDMSTALTQDLSSSATQLGKALNNPIEGIASLTRVGIQFTASQQDMITALVKSGQTLEAQNLILDEVEKKFAGSAQGAYESASSVTKLEIQVKNLKQSIGQGLTPVLNNLFSAFQDVTTGMGKNVDVGKVVFETFAAIGEFAANTVVGIHYLGSETVKFSSYVLEAFDLVGVALDGDGQAFADFRKGVDDGQKTYTDFAINLQNKNLAVLKSWGQITDEAKVFGNVGPAAYEMTADEAEAAKKKIDDAKAAIQDTKEALESLQKSLYGDDKDTAQAFIDEQKKMSDLRNQLINETDPTKQADLRAQLARENAAYTAALPQLVGNQQATEVFRRSMLTDFEQSLLNIQDRKLDTLSTDLPKIVMNVNFNDAVVGNDGITQIKNAILDTLNRASTLQRAGA